MLEQAASRPDNLRKSSQVVSSYQPITLMEVLKFSDKNNTELLGNKSVRPLSRTTFKQVDEESVGLTTIDEEEKVARSSNNEPRSKDNSR